MSARPTITSQTFCYEPLFDASTNIRLLMTLPGRDNDPISCTLKQATLHHPYTCLSYCWGLDYDHHTILVNGKTFMVRPNLHTFLYAARLYGFVQPIWIDAICINQRDNDEKSCQVQMMGRIYSRAIRTIMWLALSQEDGKALLKVEQFITSQPESWEVKAWEAAFQGQRMIGADEPLLDKISKGLPTTRDALVLTALQGGGVGDPRVAFSPEEISDPWNRLLSHWNHVVNHDGLLVRFASSDYWKRAWIVQELLLSREIGILSPSRYIQVKELLPLVINILRYLRERRDYNSDNDKELHEIQQAIFSITREMRGHPVSPISEGPEPKQIHFAEAIKLTASRLCFDVRDRVFSIVSLVQHGETLKTDYKQTLDQLLANVLDFHIRVRGSNLLICRVLPALLGNTATTLQVKPPAADSLLEILTFLNAYSDCSSTGQGHFWAKPAIHHDAKAPLEEGFSCSFCLPTEICGRGGVMEFWWRPEEAVTCYKDVFWWFKQNGCWTSKVAGNDADDLIEHMLQT
ncbi:hypothetical protein LTR70_004786 [Exophiala xenobiotica]|uniref:Heterokaryon incompatibility domain-containing protein n=1 Tax=Lithohypha guttulata TaxID=1690604 RepID=A0ABR0KCS5_9EURO|nr:hypothetical protein LTR24_004278 [Lithohypha guttulata]KAK5319876.1 hypothetical protein LTR70_004786 [Exophiala xenobiotica]